MTTCTILVIVYSLAFFAACQLVVRSDLEALLSKISANAALVSSMNSATMFVNMGHIGSVPNEVRDFAAAVRLPNVHTVCEVGFNAGHSAAVFLFSNKDVRYIAFDIGDLAWSVGQVMYLKELFPGRITYVHGDSHVSIRAFHRANPHVVCDLWSIDGDHGPSAAEDFEAAREMAHTGSGYVLADDCTDSFPAIKEIWHKQQTEHTLTSLYCHHEEVLYDGYRKGWCLGRWLPVNGKTAVSMREAVANFHRIRNTLYHQEPVLSTAGLSANCKFLVYTYLSAERWFNECARMMIQTLHASLIRAPPMCVTDILIVTDKANAGSVNDLATKYGVHFHYIEQSVSKERSSMLRLDPFAITVLRQYDVVLHVDSDMLFNIPDLNRLFVKVFEAPDKLHAYAEPTSSFTDVYHSLAAARFTAEEIAQLKSESIRPFNGALLLFRPTADMEAHFAELNRFVENYVGDYFVDQSFLNYWFCKHRLVKTSIDSSMTTIFPNDNKEYMTIVHFTGFGDSNKQNRMRAYLRRFMSWVYAYE